jgi:hypothetical protein
MLDDEKLYKGLVFHPFVCEYQEEWDGLLTDECRALIHVGAVLRVRLPAPLPSDWKEAAAAIRPEAYRAYLETDGEGDPWWGVTFANGVITFRLPLLSLVPKKGSESVVDPTNTMTSSLVLLLPMSQNAEGYGMAAATIVRCLVELREEVEEDDAWTDVTHDGEDEEEEEDEDELCGYMVSSIYRHDAGRPRGEPFYQLVGDVNELGGVSDEMTEFEWEDIEAIAYLPGFDRRGDRPLEVGDKVRILDDGGLQGEIGVVKQIDPHGSVGKALVLLATGEGGVFSFKYLERHE